MTDAPTNMGLPAGRAPRRGEGPAIAAKAARKKKGTPADKPKPGEEIVQRRHTDWACNHVHWHWLLDSFEGGPRYRNASYGLDRHGMTVRNLLRHKREYPDALENPDALQGLGGVVGPGLGMADKVGFGPFPGSLGADPGATAQDDDYEYRRSRTPIPPFLAEVVSIHMGKVFDQEVTRRGPDELVQFWADVDGAGRPAKDWMREDVAPLLMVLGCLDLVFDRPSLPPGVQVRTKQDEIDWGQDRVLCSYILPENMVWYRTDPAGNYLECLVQEFDVEYRDGEGEAGDPTSPDGRAKEAKRFRHWTQDTVALYTHDGEEIEAPRPHGYPFVPIKRLIDRKKHRTPMVGAPRYEAIAEYQREYYNRDSELILSDVLQASPLLAIPEDFLKPGQTLSIGPQFALPMKKTRDGDGYVSPQFISPPKDPAASLRENMRDIVDMKDRLACLTKPAGVSGTTGGTVSQSGYSKMFDAESGNKLLGDIAKSLAKAERQVAEFALMCVRRKPLSPADRAEIKVQYPARFQLRSAEAILDMLAKLVPVLSLDAGGPPAAADPAQEGGNPAGADAKPAPAAMIACPTIVAELLMEFSRAEFTGFPPELFEQIRRETQLFHKLPALFDVAGIESDEESMDGHGSEEEAAGQSRGGWTGATMVSGVQAVNVE